MTELPLSRVRRFLVDRYDELKRRLTTRLGSADLAGDALQDAWVRMAKVEAIGPVRNPENYVFGVAMNAARDRLRHPDNRLLTLPEIDELLGVPDEVADPAHVAEMRSELRELEAILDELPARRRNILLLARLDDMPRAQIARQLGISLRLVEKELQLAQEYCLSRRNRTKK